MIVPLRAVGGQAAPETVKRSKESVVIYPLCDRNLVGCLNLDDFGAHAYAYPMVLPKTEQRDATAVFLYGITLGLFRRFAGGNDALGHG